MRSTNSAPDFLSNSYFTGSPPTGTSITTFRLSGGLSPTGIKSIRMSFLYGVARRPVSAGLEQQVETALPGPGFHQVRIAQPIAIVDAHAADFFACLDQKNDRRLAALGIGHRRLQPIVRISQAVDADNRVAHRQPRVEGGAAPTH